MPTDKPNNNPNGQSTKVDKPELGPEATEPVESIDELRLSMPAPTVFGDTEALKLREIRKISEELAEGGIEAADLENLAFLGGTPPEHDTVVSIGREEPADAISKKKENAEHKDPFIGRTYGRYQIIELIGRGGMSFVYKARTTDQLKRTVAFKVMIPRIVEEDEQAKRRFRQEAVAAGRLSHVHIVSVFDFGEIDGQPYMVMDFLEGKCLSQIIDEKKPVALGRALNIFMQISDAFEYAHKRGVVHRDLKPSNIMLVKVGEELDFVKVVDLGIAKIITDSTDLTQVTRNGEVFGSPLYMSPEQCAAQVLDHRSDIYSMGCLMYEVITGKPPLVGQNALNTMYRQINDKPDSLKLEEFDNQDQALIPLIDRIIFKCLEKDPEQRYESMEALKRDITDAISRGARGSSLLFRLSLMSSKFISGLRSLVKKRRNDLVIRLIVVSIVVTVLSFTWKLRDAVGAVPSLPERNLPLEYVVPSSLSSPAQRPQGLGKSSVENFLKGNPGAATDVDLLYPYLKEANKLFDKGFYNDAAEYYHGVENICFKNNLSYSDEIIHAQLAHAECCLHASAYESVVSLATSVLGATGQRGILQGPDALIAFGKLGEAFHFWGKPREALIDYKRFTALLTPDNEEKCRRPLELTFNTSAAGKFFRDPDQTQADCAKLAIYLLAKAKLQWKHWQEQYPTRITVKHNLAVVENDLALALAAVGKDHEAAMELQSAYDEMKSISGKDGNLLLAKILFNQSDLEWKINPILNFVSSLEKRSRARQIWKAEMAKRDYSFEELSSPVAIMP